MKKYSLLVLLYLIILTLITSCGGGGGGGGAVSFSGSNELHNGGGNSGWGNGNTTGAVSAETAVFQAVQTNCFLSHSLRFFIRLTTWIFRLI